MTDTFLDSYISTVYLLSNVALIEELPRIILSKIASPEHISLIFQLYDVADCAF